MKKIIYIITICSMVVLISACGSSRYKLYNTRSSEIAVEVTSLKKQFSETKSIIQLKRLEFSANEWRKIVNTNATIDMLIEKYEAIGKLKSSEASLADVEFLWQLAIEGYYQAKDVVIAKFSSMDPSTKIMLKSYDKRVNETDTVVASLLASPSEDNINDAMLLISGTLNYSAKMLSTLATSL